MAWMVQNLLFLTMLYVLLHGSKRVTKKLYRPYGPKMCIHMCEDVANSYIYTKEDLSCQRLLVNDTNLSRVQNSFTYIKEETMVKDNTSLTGTPLYDRCEAYFKDKGPSDLQWGLSKGNISSGDLGVHHNTVLHQACKEGLSCKVKYILSQRRADINCRGRFGRTPVMVAAQKGHVAVFDFLVSQGCDLKAVDDDNNTVLHVACMGDNANIIRKLLVLEYNIEARGHFLWTPVMFAAFGGMGDAFNLLVSKGCNMALLDMTHSNILHLACQGGNVDIVRYILSQNITNTDARGYMGMTPFMFAVDRGHRRVYDFLKKRGCDLNVVDTLKRNALHVACAGGNINMVKYIISERIYDIESREQRGRTPVMVAAVHGRVEVFDFLARLGVDLTTVDRFKNNILHLACKGGHVDMVKRILSHSIVNIDSRGYFSMTPVMIAVKHGHQNVIDLLRRRGCSLRTLDDFKDNILHIACLGGHVDFVRHFLSQGIVDIDSKGFGGRTCVLVAAGNGHKDMVKLLHRKGCNMRTCDENSNNILHLACLGGHVNVVRYILSQGVTDVDSRGFCRRTPVLIAAGAGHKGVVRLLWKRGCNIRAEDAQRNNILHMACMGGHVNIVRYLLSLRVVNRWAKNKLDMTPVQLADSKGHSAVVALLNTNV